MEIHSVNGLRPGFSVLGQDARLAAAAQVLCDAGWTHLPPENCAAAQAVLLGTPTPTLHPFAAQLAQLRPGTPVFAGAVSPAARGQAAEYGLALVDYMQSEELTLFNAVPTAEGALAILLTATPETLWRSAVLLVGFGRVAAALAPRLAALGMRVTVVARRAAVRMQAQTLGFEAAACEELPSLAVKTDFLINTVPYPLVDETVLRALPPHAFVLELAGAPGGIATGVAEKLGVRVRAAPGLPGKIAPAAAGRAVGRTVLEFLQRAANAAQTGEKE